MSAIAYSRRLHTDLVEAPPFSEKELRQAGLWGEGEPLSLFARIAAPTLTIFLVFLDASPEVKRALEIMERRPDLLSESRGYFSHPCYTSTYHFALRPVSLRASVPEQLEPAQIPFLVLTNSWRFF